MKKILAMLLLIPSLALANPLIQNVETVCLTGEKLTDLTDEYKELPYVRGVSSEGISLVVFVNAKTRSFTIAERREQNTYCVLMVGGGFELVPKKIQDDIKQQQEKATL
jgi:hypothetical protein